MKSVDKRHDCVHRNGNDRDGNQHTDITNLYLTKLGVLFEQVAATLEDAMQETKIKRFFVDLSSNGQA
jgi:hypothetical protein